MHRRRFLGALPLAALATVTTLPLLSATVGAAQPFDTAAFEAAKKSGKPVLVYVHATWCPTCRKQEPAIKALLDSPEFGKFQVFKVDFDGQPDVLSALGVTRQSTIIVFKGGKEVSRATGVTQSDAIAQHLRKAV